MFPNAIFKIIALGLTSLSGCLALGPAPVILGPAGNFAILAQSGVSTVPQSSITGNVGISPAAASFLTGFSMVKGQGGTHAFSTQVTGRLEAADFAQPTPVDLTASINAYSTAFADAAGRPAPASNTDLGGGSIGGLTFAPGVYRWTSTVNIGNAIAIKGTAEDTWIFQVASVLTLGNSVSVILAGGALPKNIVWVVTGTVALGTGSTFQGIILGATSVALSTGASINGRILVGTAVTLQKATVVAPA